MNSEKEISVSWRTILTIGVIAFLLIALCIAIVMVYLVGSDITSSTPTSSLPPISTAIVLSDEEAGNVASQVVVAYFTVDYSDSQKWIDQFANISTQHALSALETSYLPYLFPALESEKTISSVELISSTQISTGVDQTTGEKWQIWKIDVSLDQEWPSFNTPFMGPIAFPQPDGQIASTHVLVLQEQGRWQFSLFPTQNLVDTMSSSNPDAD
jgi:hypothetical protein